MEYFTEDGHINEQVLASYADQLTGIHDGDQPADVIEHVSECLQCKLAIMELIEVSEENPELKHKSMFPSHGLFSLNQRMLKIAAIFLLLIGAVLFLLFSSILKTKEISLSKPQDTPVAQVENKVSEEGFEISENTKQTSLDNKEADRTDEKEQLANNYTPVPYLESMVDEMMRAGNLKVISPENGKILGVPIIFKWENGVLPVILAIVDNNDKVIFSRSMKESEFQYNENLSPGLYYWKIENEDETLYVGKFIIK